MPKLAYALIAAVLVGCGQQAGTQTSATAVVEVATALPETTAPPAATAAPVTAAPEATQIIPPTVEPAATAAPEATQAIPPTIAEPTEAATNATSAPEPTAFVPVATAPAQSTFANITLKVEQITGELSRPVYATHAGDGSGRLFVVEKAGRIRIVRDGQVADDSFLDITDRVGASGSEQGLLSVAFHPRFAENGQLFVDYTDKKGDTVISRFTASGDSADAASETVLLQIDQPYANHNGGLVKFGPDGFLYIGMGDGGSGGDPQNNGQNPKALLGKMLRIDVDGGSPYGIPADNPYADGANGAPEVWAIGFRNPWRYSFDKQTGDLFIGDVGQNAIEEVDFQKAGTGAGANYGWNVTEGRGCYRGDCDPSQFVLPVAQYTHSEGGCSVTGGYVYRGAAYPTLQGIYLFGDYCSGKIWGLQQNASGEWAQGELLQSGLQISSFGEDEAGELYITSLGDNGLYRITAG